MVTNGTRGDRGPQGYQGFTGYTGFQGFQGYTGYTGFQGFQGHATYASNTDIDVKNLNVHASGSIGSGYSSATPSNGELIVENKVGIGSSDPDYTLDITATDAM